jgi:hypothetical protein
MTPRTAILMLLCLATSTAHALETPIELQPYRVALALADDTAATYLATDLAELSSRTWGGQWDLRLESVDRPGWADRRRFEHLSPRDFADGPECDVHYLVWIARNPVGVTVRVRAWEPLWSHLSPVATAEVADVRDVPLRVLQLCRKLFRPRATWERHDDVSARLAVQAAALAAPDPEFAVLQPHEVFTPWIILRGRDGVIQRQQAIPWTYLVVDTMSQGRGVAHVTSGLQAPLSAKARGRTEFTAVAVRPQWPETRLECVSSAKPPRALSAHRVELSPVATAPVEEGTDPPPPEIAVTDRHGRLLLRTTERPDLIWAAVYSGTLRLARVPLLAGSAHTVRLELPDDAIRLLAEGRLQVVQSELVDVVALRAVKMVAARAAGKKEDWKTADTQMADARRHSEPKPFLEQIAAIRLEAVAAAMKRSDRTTEQRVIRMCDETTDVVKRFLDDERLRLLQEELDELKLAAQEAKEPDPPPKAASKSTVRSVPQPKPPEPPKPPSATGGF